MSQTSPPPPPGAATGRPVGEIRSPWVVIGLTLITCGIYHFVWTYKTFNEMKKYSGDGLGGALALFLQFFGVGAVILMFMFPAEVGNLYEREGHEKPVSGVTGLWNLLLIIGTFIWLFKTLGALNDFWRAHGATS